MHSVLDLQFRDCTNTRPSSVDWQIRRFILSLFMHAFSASNRAEADFSTNSAFSGTYLCEYVRSDRIGRDERLNKIGHNGRFQSTGDDG